MNCRASIDLCQAVDGSVVMASGFTAQNATLAGRKEFPAGMLYSAAMCTDSSSQRVG
jgi:hypothetical protein